MTERKCSDADATQNDARYADFLRIANSNAPLKSTVPSKPSKVKHKKTKSAKDVT